MAWQGPAVRVTSCAVVVLRADFVRPVNRKVKPEVVEGSTVALVKVEWRVEARERFHAPWGGLSKSKNQDRTMTPEGSDRWLRKTRTKDPKQN